MLQRRPGARQGCWWAGWALSPGMCWGALRERQDTGRPPGSLPIVPLPSSQKIPRTPSDEDCFFDLLSKFQSNRMDDQRCPLEESQTEAAEAAATPVPALEERICKYTGLLSAGWGVGRFLGVLALMRVPRVLRYLPSISWLWEGGLRQGSQLLLACKAAAKKAGRGSVPQRQENHKRNDIFGLRKCTCLRNLGFAVPAACLPAPGTMKEDAVREPTGQQGLSGQP